MKKIKKEDKFEMYKVFKKMCEYVDAPLSVIGSGNKWFQKYTWTEKKQKEFSNWMTYHLYHNEDARLEFMAYPRKNKKDCKKAVDMFVFNYGWKIEE